MAMSLISFRKARSGLRGGRFHAPRSDVPANYQLRRVRYIVLVTREGIPKDAFAVRPVELDADIADQRQPPRDAAAEQLGFAMLDVNLEQVHPRETTHAHESRHV